VRGEKLSEASAYVMEDIQKKMESANSRLASYLRKSSRAVSAKKDVESYEKELGVILDLLEKTLEEYPGDGELKGFSERFYNFYSTRKNETFQAQMDKISNFLSDLKSLVHWRKMETAYGRTLGFSDFRSLRGESKKR
jgi:hypothetical protein